MSSDLNDTFIFRRNAKKLTVRFYFAKQSQKVYNILKPDGYLASKIAINEKRFLVMILLRFETIFILL